MTVYYKQRSKSVVYLHRVASYTMHSVAVYSAVARLYCVCLEITFDVDYLASWFVLTLSTSHSSGPVQARRDSHRCLHNKAPQYRYLADCCVVVSELAGRQRLRSAQRRQLDVPRYQRSTFGRRAFSVAGPTVWNSLPDELRNATDEAFSRLLKTFMFSQY